METRPTRNLPASTIRNIVDFLMFHHTSLKHDSAHAFIMDHIGTDIQTARDSVSLRCKDFYRLVAYMIRETDWTQDAWVDVLDDFQMLEARYGPAGTVAASDVSARKWQNIKMEIAFQMGLAELRARLNLPARDIGDEDIIIPATLSQEEYHKTMVILFDRYRQVYVTDPAGHKVHHKYQQQLDSLTTNLYVEKEVTNKSGQGRQRSVVKVLDPEEVQDLLTEHKCAATVAMLVAFVQQLETKVLPLPVDVGKCEHTGKTTGSSSSSRGAPSFPPAAVVPAAVPAAVPVGSRSGSAAQAPLQRQQQQQQQQEGDWDDGQADNAGPYHEPAPEPAPEPAATAPAPARSAKRGGRPAQVEAARPESENADESSVPEMQAQQGARVTRARVAQQEAVPPSPAALTDSPARRGRRAAATAASQQAPSGLAPAVSAAKATTPASGVDAAAAPGAGGAGGSRSAAGAGGAGGGAGGSRSAAGAAAGAGGGVHDTVLSPATKMKRKLEALSSDAAIAAAVAAGASAAKNSRDSLPNNRADTAAKTRDGSAAKSSRIDNGPSGRKTQKQVDYSDDDQDQDEDAGNNDAEDSDNSRNPHWKGRRSGPGGVPSTVKAAKALVHKPREAPTGIPKFPTYVDSPEQPAAEENGNGNGNSERKKTPRKRWTFEQEEMLRIAVDRHGEGNWQVMLNDPDFEDALRGRTNVNLKDKWRNLQKNTKDASSN